MKAFSIALLLIPSLLCAAATAPAQHSKTPFQLSWVSGSCRNCELVRQLGQIHFIDQRTVWSVGYYFPTEGQGAGDNSIIHSSNSGGQWAELAQSRMHAAEPSLSFVDRRRGWVSGMSVDGSAWTIRTIDGGLHWTKISDDFIQSMEFISASVGVGTEFDGKSSLFAKTTDGGRTWSTSSVPNMKFINKVFFITPRLGWLAGTNDSGDLGSRSAFVLSTTDGGANWTSARIPSHEGVAEIRDLYFLNDEIGWLITWHYNNDGTHLYQTRDGGRSWTLHPDSVIQGTGRWLSVVRFVDSSVGFAFSFDDTIDSVNDPNVAAVVANPQSSLRRSGRLFYTDDGGQHWSGQRIAGWVYDCQVLGSDLGCSASRDKKQFSILHISVAKTTSRRNGE